jgi:hypothetical protein
MIGSGSNDAHNERSASCSRHSDVAHPTYKIATPVVMYSTAKIVYSRVSAIVRPNRSQPASFEITAATNGWAVVERIEVSSEYLKVRVSCRYLDREAA